METFVRARRHFVMTMHALIIITAFMLDAVFGDPHWFPHPVRAIGWFIQRAESVLRSFSKRSKSKRIAGVALVLLTIVLVYALSHYLLLTAFRMSWYFGFILSAFLAYTTLAARSLADAAQAVLRRLDAGDIVGARSELSLIVGRDTQYLDEQEITRAVVETVAENASDGVIAPLFYLAMGGPALSLAYKAVNTLDSMIGYKNETYIDFGWAAARLDDAANYLPARITAVLICFASQGASLLSPVYKQAWHIMLRDGRKHPSPNSGYPEAAMAGALGIRLGGPSVYGGKPSHKPYLGDAKGLFDKKLIEKSVLLMYSATLFGVFCAAAIKSFF